MKLYHGTTSEFDEIDLSKSKPNKDFGRGFYLSAELEQAKDFAQTRALLLGGSPVIVSYEFDERLLTSNELKVKTFGQILSSQIETTLQTHSFTITIL